MAEATLLVAGASGAVGFEVLRLLHQRDRRVHTLSRHPGRAQKLEPLASKIHLADAMKPKSLEGVCEGVDTVISSLGASVGMHLGQRAPYTKIDVEANRNLLAEAKRAGCSRFVYVSVCLGDGYAHTRYIQAHEAFVEELKGSGLSHAVIRPTGVFTALADLVPMTRMGVLPVIGDGSAKTNPVHPVDVAEFLVEHVDDGPEDAAIGGAQILSRKDIARAAFEATGRKARFLHVPAWALRFQSFCLRLLHPRLSQLVEFATAVSTTDAIGPQIGGRTLKDYFAELASKS